MKSVLMVIPFENIYPPMNGGMLRCFNLLNQLCKYFDVTALMHQDEQSFRKSEQLFPAIKTCRILSTKNNQKDTALLSLVPLKYRDALKSRIWSRSFNTPAETNFLLLYPQMKQFLKKQKPDYVVLEDMAILELSKLVERYAQGTPVIYDAYNVNSILASADYEKGSISKNEYEYILKIEKSLYQHVGILFTCSETDLEKLKELNQGKIQGTVIPNGVGIPEKSGRLKLKSEASPEILFCGSLDYFPNREGLTWFCREIFPLILKKIPEAKLIVVGKGDPGTELAEALKRESVINYGRVESVDDYYARATLAIVPLLSGSGTRLKLLESMAFKVPVVSTTAGAEGIDYIDGVNIKIADDPVRFADQVVELLTGTGLASKIAKEAFQLVENRYDWNIIGKRMADYLNSLN